MINFKYILISIIVLVLLAGSVGAYFLYKTSQPKITACTMEAKLCPDGSAVGRTGPNCEFAACPVVELSGIKGVALLGPMCPAQKNPTDPACADRPYKTHLAATTHDQTQIIEQFNSNDNGEFSVDLPAGEYFIISSDTASMFSKCLKNNIKVEENKYTEIILNCDTGIR